LRAFSSIGSLTFFGGALPMVPPPLGGTGPGGGMVPVKPGGGPEEPAMAPGGCTHTGGRSKKEAEEQKLGLG